MEASAIKYQVIQQAKVLENQPVSDSFAHMIQWSKVPQFPGLGGNKALIF
jgi:hypothetical protein